MPGLFGIFSKRQGLSEQRLLSMAQRMADSMKRVPWLRVEILGDATFCGGRVHLGVQSPSPQPLVTSDRSTQVWFDGDYYPTPTGSDTTLTANELSTLLSGPSLGLREIDGVFALACFNTEKEELTLANDRLGFRPLYYTETADWFAYGGEVKALLAILDKLPDLDEVSLRQFFGFDHMLGERTWWKGIELIPPASLWRISAKGRTRHQYWTFDDIQRDPQDEADVQAEFSRLWSQDVGRHSKPGTMPLLLSGGQDSRLLLAELHAQGADLVAITYGSEESPEMKPARRIASIAGIPHRPVYLNTKNWWHHREEAVWETDGLVSASHLTPVIAADEMHTGNCYSPLNIAGDLLFGGSHLDKALMPTWQLSPEKLLSARYMENPFFDRGEVLTISVPDAKRYVQGPSSDCFHLGQRYRRYVLHSPGCLASYCEMGFTGVSYALLKLTLGSLSDERRIGHKFYNSWLVDRYPAYYANVPWQATGRGIAESLPTKLSRDIQAHLPQLAKRVANRYPRWFGELPWDPDAPDKFAPLPARWLRNVAIQLTQPILKRAKPVPVDQWFVNYPECLRASKIREKLLREDLLAAEFLGGAVRRALTNHQGPPLNSLALITLLTFETYLRQVAGKASLPV